MNIFQWGFTLIELIIVIAIIAILAAGLLAGLDPMEQIAKSQDITNMTLAKELKEAVNRFIVGQGEFPGWKEAMQQNGLGFSNVNILTGSVYPYIGTSGQGAMATGIIGGGDTKGLLDVGETKISLLKSIGKNGDYIWLAPESSAGAGQPADSVFVCIRPKSKQFKERALYYVSPLHTPGSAAPLENPAQCPAQKDNCFVCIE